MDLKNSILLANMMQNNSGIEFKNYCYALNNAYIQTDISLNENFNVRVAGKRNKSYTSATSLFLFGASGASGSYTLGTNCTFSYSSGIGQSSVAILTYDGTGYPPSGSTRHYFGANDFDISLSNVYYNNTVSIIMFCSRHIDYFLNDYVFISLIEIKDLSDNLIVELKPAIVNGENGMYDTVGQKFYGNTNSVGSIVCE